MSKTVKRIITIMLSFAMLVSVLPAGVYEFDNEGKMIQ